MRANASVRDLCFYVGSYIAYIVELSDVFNADIFYDNTFWTIDQIQTRLYDVSSLFEDFGNIFLLYCLVDLGLSFLQVSKGASKGHNIVRGMTVGLAVVLFAMTVGHFGKTESWRTDYYNAINSDINSDFLERPYSIVQLTAAFDIILWIASVAVAAFTIYILIVSHETAQIRNVI
jgi:hypothetical protein